MKILLLMEGFRGGLQQVLFLKSRRWDAEGAKDVRRLKASIHRYRRWKFPPALVVVGDADVLEELDLHPTVRLLPVPETMPGGGGCWGPIPLSFFLQEALTTIEEGA